MQNTCEKMFHLLPISANISGCRNIVTQFGSVWLLRNVTQHCWQNIRSFCQQTSKPIFSLYSLQLSCYVHLYLVYCFAGESTMHHVQTLWKSCFPGSKHWQAAKKAALKKGMCLVDKTEFELGTNTAQHYLRTYCTSEGYNKITPNKFLIVPMQKKHKEW